MGCQSTLQPGNVEQPTLNTEHPMIQNWRYDNSAFDVSATLHVLSPGGSVARRPRSGRRSSDGQLKLRVRSPAFRRWSQFHFFLIAATRCNKLQLAATPGQNLRSGRAT